MKAKVISIYVIMLGISLLKLQAQNRLVIDGRGTSGNPITIIDDTLFVFGNVNVVGNSNQGRNIHNAGTIFLSDTLINGVNNLFLSSSNPYLDNSGTSLDTTYGNIIFGGTRSQYISGNEFIYFNNIQLNNPNHLFLGTDIKAFGTVWFNQGLLRLNNHTLHLFDNSTGIRRHGGNLQNEGESHRVADLLYTENVSNYVRAFSPSINTQLNVGNLGAEVTRGTGNIIVERGHVPITEVNGTSLPWFYNFYSDITNENEPGSILLHYNDYDFTGLDYDESSISIFSAGRDLSSGPQIHVTSVDETNNTAEATELNLLKRYFISNGECDSDIALTLTSDTNVCIRDTITLDPLEGFERIEEYFCEWYLINAQNEPEIIGTDHTLDVWAFSEESVKYVVNVTNLMGCTGTDTTIVHGRSLPDAVFQVTPFTCENDTIQFNNLSSVSAGELSYVWNFGDNTISNDENPEKSYNEYGTYTVRLDVYSEYQCADSAIGDIPVFDKPVADFTYEKVCNSLTLRCVNNTSLDEGEINESVWESIAGNITYNSSAALDNVLLTFDQPGSYEVTLTAANRYGNCRDSVTRLVELIPNDIPDFTYAGNCFGDETRFTNTSVTVGESAVFTWDINEEGFSAEENPVYTFDTPGDYEVTLTIDNNNCDTGITKLITIHELPYAGFTFENSCARNNVGFLNLTEDSLQYSWTSGSQTSQEPNPHFVFDTEGSYNVELEVISGTGCSAASAEVVEIYPVPVASFIREDACFGDTLYFENTSYISGSENLTSYWEFGDGNYAEEMNPYHQYTDTYGMKEVMLVVTSENYNCVDTIIQDIEILGNPTVGFMTEEHTCGDFLILTPQDEAVYYHWQDGSAEPEYTVYEDGYYWVRITDENGCEDTDTIYVELDDDVIIPLPDEVSNCGPVTLDAGYFPGGSYNWNTGENTQNITAAESGVYEVIVVDQNECTDTARCNVSVFENPSVEIMVNENSCVGLTEEAIVATDADSITWNIESTGEVISGIDRIQITESGLVQVTVVSSNYCDAQDAVTITFHEPPELHLEKNVTGCNEAQLDPLYFGTGYAWSTGENTSTIIVTESGEYWVEVTDDNNCKSTDTSLVHIDHIEELELGNDLYKCEYEEVTIGCEDYGEGYTYEWSDGSNTNTIIASDEGTYHLTISRNDFCHTSDTIEVFNNESPYAEITEEQYLCSDAGRIVPDFVDNISEFKWYLNGELIGYDVEQEISEPGRYWVNMSSDSGCVISDTITVYESTKKIDALFLVADSLRAGDTLKVFNASSTLAADFEWDFGDGHVVNQVEGPVHVYYIEGDFTITLTANTGECTDVFRKIRTVKGYNPGYIKSQGFPWGEEKGLVEFLNSKLYPNPVTDKVTLEFDINIPSDLYLSIFDINGRALHFKKILVEEHYAEEFNFSRVHAGIYFIKVSSLNSAIIHKVVVVK